MLKYLLFFIIVFYIVNLNVIYEGFDENCINKIIPKFTFNISEYYQKDEFGNVKFDEAGNIVINYNDIDMESYYENDMIKGVVNDIDYMTQSPFSFENNLLNVNNCERVYVY